MHVSVQIVNQSILSAQKNLFLESWVKLFIQSTHVFQYCNPGGGDDFAPKTIEMSVTSVTICPQKLKSVLPFMFREKIFAQCCP